MRSALLPILLPGLALIALLAGCEREARGFGQSAASSRVDPAATRLSSNEPGERNPGEVRAPIGNTSPYDGNAYAVAQGKRLFRWYNCSGCHANGGGGMGPALTDDQWLYGREPAQIFETIMRGRPNGMPSFAGHITEGQAWQIVAYVRSMDERLRKDVAPGRSDALYPGPPEVVRAPLVPGAPPPLGKAP